MPSITDGLIDRGSQTKTDGSMDGVPIWRPLWGTDCEEVSHLNGRFQTKAERTVTASNSRSPRVAGRVGVVDYIGRCEVLRSRTPVPTASRRCPYFGWMWAEFERDESLGPALVQLFELGQH